MSDRAVAATDRRIVSQLAPGVTRSVPEARSSKTAGYGAAAAGVALITAIIHLVPGARHLTNISLLYLLAVIVAALRFGRGPAVATSILAFLAFDWFFTRPYFTLTVRDPAEWLALGMFLVTATVTGQLTALLRARADEARRREREAVALAEASWAVATQVDRHRALEEILRRVSDVVEPVAAAILTREAEGPLTPIAQVPALDAPPRVDAEAVCFVLEHGSPIGWGSEGGHWRKALAHTDYPDAIYLPLVTQDRVIGVLYLRLREDQPVAAEERRTVESLAHHAAVVLERDRLVRAEAHAQALAEADRLKTALLSMVSHDFRSPLTSIKATASAIRADGTPVDARTLNESLIGIEREADRLDRMVGNILALSQLEAEAWQPQIEAVLPDELVGAALQSFSREENRRIRVVSDPTLSEVWLDPVEIVQVLHNLVDNALKYSPADQSVEVRLQREAEWLTVEVLDRGAGLPPGDEDRVFEPFYRAPGLRESAVPGVGIGLAVCRGLVEAHGGRLTARNRENGGTLFRFTLPTGWQKKSAPTNSHASSSH